MAVDERKNFRLQKEIFQILPVIESLTQQFKLKADPSVQIVNIRGIGYKLIIYNDQ